MLYFVYSCKAPYIHLVTRRGLNTWVNNIYIDIYILISQRDLGASEPGDEVKAPLPGGV